MNQVLTEANALSLILNHARGIGLPLPHAFRYDEAHERLVLNFRAVADIRDWARWMDAPLHSESLGRQTHWCADGTALDARVRVVAFSIDATNAEVETVGLTVASEPVEDGVSLIGGGA